MSANDVPPPRGDAPELQFDQADTGRSGARSAESPSVTCGFCKRAIRLVATAVMTAPLVVSVSGPYKIGVGAAAPTPGQV